MDDDGAIKLMSAMIEQAVEEYNTHLLVCNYVQARISAVTDSRGIMGRILAFALDDPEYYVKQIDLAEKEGRLSV